jgi:glycerol uptake facilitator-like aquaporin
MNSQHPNRRRVQSLALFRPAITSARSLSDTFAGIRPGDVPGFIFAQLLGEAMALVIARMLFAEKVDTGSSAGR